MPSLLLVCVWGELVRRCRRRRPVRAGQLCGRLPQSGGVLEGSLPLGAKGESLVRCCGRRRGLIRLERAVVVVVRVRRVAPNVRVGAVAVGKLVLLMVVVVVVVVVLLLLLV